MPVAIGAAVAVALGLTGIAAAVVGTVVSFAITAAVTVGIGLIAGALQQRSSPLPTPSDGQSELKQPITSRIKSYGTVRVAGSVWWHSAVGTVLYKGLAINQGRIGRIVSYHIDENQVDIDGTDKVTSVPYNSNNVYLHHRLGLPAETKYSEIFTAFGVDQVRGDGVATVLATVENPTGGGSAAAFQNTYPGGEPEIRETIDASVVYDPRNPAHDPDDESTWEFSDNPVVCLMDYITSSDGYGIPRDDVDRNIAQWTEQMDICDELVMLAAGGFAKRYRVAGSYRLTDDPFEVVKKFESCCDGRVWVKRDGSIGVTVGKFVAPTVTLDDDHITGYEGLVRGPDALNEVAGIRGEFMSPDHDYREHEAEPWPTGEAVAELSEDRVAALDLLWVPSASQARRLEKRAYLRANAPWRGTIHTDAAGLLALDERYIGIQIAELNLDITGEINSVEFDPGGPTCAINFTAIDATIDDWDAATEEGTEESLNLDFVTFFAKSGAGVDPVGEAGGQVGQLCYIFASQNQNVTPATPAGWTAVAGTRVGSMWGGIIAKRLDGTETTVAVNGVTNGNIVVMLVRGANAVSVSDKVERVEASNYSQSFATPSTPFIGVAMVYADTDFDPTQWGALLSGDTKVNVTEHFSFSHSNSNTLEVMISVYHTDEAPPAGLIGDMGSDEGTNGLTVLNILPG